MSALEIQYNPTTFNSDQEKVARFSTADLTTVLLNTQIWSKVLD